MVSIVGRMRRLNTLLGIRLGPGAAILSSDIKRIHLEFARDNKDGHMGPRKFWRNYLPRLKYHNPAIPMTVTRHTDNAGPATLSVHFGDPESVAAPSKQSQPADVATSPSVDMIKQINMKARTDSAIWKDFMELTSAELVHATAEEDTLLQELKDMEERSMQDRKQSLELLEAQRKQAAILAQARASMEAPA